MFVKIQFSFSLFSPERPAPRTSTNAAVAATPSSLSSSRRFAPPFLTVTFDRLHLELCDVIVHDVIAGEVRSAISDAVRSCQQDPPGRLGRQVRSEIAHWR